MNECMVTVEECPCGIDLSRHRVLGDFGDGKVHLGQAPCTLWGS